MNERIQTLLAKFKETESTHRGAHVLIGIDEIEKFAELIVKEVTNIVLHFTDVDEGVAVAKKHFGVEE